MRPVRDSADGGVSVPLSNGRAQRQRLLLSFQMYEAALGCNPRDRRSSIGSKSHPGNSNLRTASALKGLGVFFCGVYESPALLTARIPKEILQIIEKDRRAGFRSGKVWCGREDSNLHGIATVSPSS
jgi:hypothetical protein